MKRLLLVVVSLAFSSAAIAEKADLVLIKKSERLLILKKGKDELRRYSVALGGNPVGPKKCQGDEKTPEGDYVIVSRNSKSSFYKSLKVSYPSEVDKKKARQLGCNPGGDIMIHGLPNGRGDLGASHRLVDWTLGCIAVTNSEIDEIWKLVSDGTSVKILP